MADKRDNGNSGRSKGHPDSARKRKPGSSGANGVDVTPQAHPGIGGDTANVVASEPGTDDDRAGHAAGNAGKPDSSAIDARAKPGKPAATRASSGKNIVIFSDGTGQEGGVGNNTNVYSLFNMILDRTEHQISFYDQGLGTGNNRLWGSIAGAGISENVGEAYQFLSDNFNARDRIYLFGFSRGATTVRSLAGFIHLFGILPRSRPELFYRAWDIYRIRNKYKRAKRAEEFIRRNHTMWTKIRFLGVWDTVAALALPFKPLEVLRNLFPWFHYSFHDLKMSKSVEYGRHAVAIDDQRRTFHPVLFEESGARIKAPSLAGGDLFSGADVTNLDLAAKTIIAQEPDDAVFTRLYKQIDESARSELRDYAKLQGRLASPQARDKLRDTIVRELNKTIECNELICDIADPATKEKLAGLKLSAATQESLDEIASVSSPSPECINRTNRLLLEDICSLKPRIKQVWFAGMHSDVGGGYAQSELAHIPLLWMMSEAMDLGLRIYANHRVDLRPDLKGPMHDSRAGLASLYRRGVRHWEEQDHQGRPPLVHESVKERERNVPGYKAWITKHDYEIEPWPKRLQSSIQYDDDRVWRHPFWGWGADFNESWSDIERISLNESKSAITLHMRTTGSIHVQGSLPCNLQPVVEELERKREHHRLQAVDEQFDGVHKRLKVKVDTLEAYVAKLDRYIIDDQTWAKNTEGELAQFREVKAAFEKLKAEIEASKPDTSADG